MSAKNAVDLASAAHATICSNVSPPTENSDRGAIVLPARKSPFVIHPKFHIVVVGLLGLSVVCRYGDVLLFSPTPLVVQVDTQSGQPCRVV